MHANYVCKAFGDFRGVDERIEHIWAAVRQDGEFVVTKQRKCPYSLLMQIEMQIIPHEPIAKRGGWRDADARQRKFQRSSRDQPEILVGPHQTTKPCIFKLLQTPQLCNDFALVAA